MLRLQKKAARVLPAADFIFKPLITSFPSTRNLPTSALLLLYTILEKPPNLLTEIIIIVVVANGQLFHKRYAKAAN